MCPICLDDTNNTKLIYLECGHKFCDICIKEWMEIKNECPICRKLSYKFIQFEGTLGSSILLAMLRNELKI